MSALPKDAGGAGQGAARGRSHRSTLRGGPRFWQGSLLTATSPAFAKLDVDWASNPKLRQVSAPAVLLWFALLAFRAREGLAATFEAQHVELVDRELEAWRRELGPIAPLLAELAGAGLLAQDLRRRWTMPGWNPKEWGTGYPRGAARAGLDRCTRCHGARPAEPGRKSCRDCRERDRARWDRRKMEANARRRQSEERHLEEDQ